METVKGWTTIRISMETFKLLEKIKKHLITSQGLNYSFDKILYMLLYYFSNVRVPFLKCKRCGHVWVSTTNFNYVTCPSCQRKVNVKKELVRRK